MFEIINGTVLSKNKYKKGVGGIGWWNSQQVAKEMSQHSHVQWGYARGKKILHKMRYIDVCMYSRTGYGL